MILDNKNLLNKKSQLMTVWEYLKKYTKGENLNIVSGFFTISALALLKKFDEEPKKFRLILSEIAGHDDQKERVIDILQGTSDLSNAFSLQTIAQKAIDILKQDNVELRRIDNTFCHAKTYIYEAEEADDCFFIAGSSNFTEKGLGYYKDAGNIEFNVARKGFDGDDFQGTLKWFEDIWNNVAKDTVEVFENDKKVRKTVKQYFIDCIENFCKEYMPRDIYYKILFELFHDDIELTFSDGANRSITRMEDSVIWNVLFDYQRKGVRSLISMLSKYNGAILADAVGLGKTFSALAVIKYFQGEGYFTLVLCPKKLQANWEQYLSHQGSRFERDEFDYEVRFHTDLQEGRLDSYTRAPLSFLKSRPKMLIVIDESHNLRNDKSGRYKYLVETLLKRRPHDDIKVLELSATPVNNHLMDVRNQFKLMVRDADNGFNIEGFNIPSLMDLFRRAQGSFEKWSKQEGERHIKDLVDALPDAFFNLTDRLVVARTRKMVEKATGTDLHFPKQNKPTNIFKALSEIGDLATFEDIYDALMAPNMVAYQPSAYTEKPSEKVMAINDQRQREFFLCKMMLILFLKRLESSWVACKTTVENVLIHHENTLAKVNAFIAGKGDSSISDMIDLSSIDEELDNPEFMIGKKNPIHLSEILDIEGFKRDLEQDVRLFHVFVDNMNLYDKQFKAGKVKDSKLERLKDILSDKVNKSHKRVLIFTSYSDTAQYLYEQLNAEFPGIVAVVDGDGAMFKGVHEKKFQFTLCRFSPMSKLYREMDWVPLYKQYFKQGDDHYDYEKRKWNVSFAEWKKVIECFKNSNEMARKAQQALDEPVRILIATDCLSEGQNLQDAQTVVNYDIHWNPTRLIQRQGRIDRIGSVNKEIDCVNFWPAKNYDGYLNLFNRVNSRLAAMAVIGTEIPEVSEELTKTIKDNPILDRNDQKLLDDVMETGQDQGEETFGLHDLSLETFRQDLVDILKENEKYYRNMPNGIYSGFRTGDDLFERIPESIVALVRQKDTGEMHLVLRPVEDNRDEVQIKEYNKQEILSLLRSKLNMNRYVPTAIDKASPEIIAKLHAIMALWAKEKAPKAAVSVVKDLFGGVKKSKGQTNKLVEDHFRAENLELLVWEYISKK
ncbi:helicase-related protein [Phocaeicola plebeius]|uniref:helicase-related protein n=1 Tax=Phocaeicola plebeius TaxID=310297 RepID=UPI0026F35320|nr:helicase-related protein [Phocaeicola plebeius]MCI6051460.1 SNF2-related protein [Phocaeicola plebeius]MDD6913416.1 helicase-related protein [Phocaeicola plebeius]MDY5978851.1 helicase-related protein [Phocaeicola plebeius]